jgi:hypothetical protein
MIQGQKVARAAVACDIAKHQVQSDSEHRSAQQNVLLQRSRGNINRRCNQNNSGDIPSVLPSSLPLPSSSWLPHSSLLCDLIGVLSAPSRQ